LHISFTHTCKTIIGQRIKFFREKNNFTQQELGDLIGADRQYVWQVESGKKNMTFNNLDKIINALKCGHAEFFNL
jgi:transcriptional regulator with XRE-family HTH domain